MQAIIKIAGKQYRVSEGDIIEVEKLKAQKDEVLEFSDVLLTFDNETKIKIGVPYVPKAKVEAKVLEPEIKGKKITIIKFKPKKRYKKKIGARQKYTKVKIEKIIV